MTEDPKEVEARPPHEASPREPKDGTQGVTPPVCAKPGPVPDDPVPLIVPDDDPEGDDVFDADAARASAAAGGVEGLPVPPNLGGRRRGRRLVKRDAVPRASLTGPQRLLLLDAWRRSALPAGDFAALVGVSKHTLYAWRKRFEEGGPAALMDEPRGAKKGSRLPEPTRRAILMMKEDNPDWGCRRISDMLARSHELGASPGAVAHVLHEAGYETEDVPTTPHRDHPRSFERARPNQLWQTDLFTFMLKRQNRRVHLVAFMDDHSRFIVGYGLHATASAVLVIEVLRAAIVSYQAPEELLSDNGPQYVTWRGRSAFSRECETRGIKHIVASPRHPQTVGKTERFWGTLWRECVERAVFLDLEDARRRIGYFIDYYNFKRPHQGIGSAIPAERFFGAAPAVLASLKARVAANAQSLAVNGIPKQPLFITGKVGDQTFSVHAEGERVILTKPGEERQEIDLTPPAPQSVPDPICPHAAPKGDEGNEPPPEPGTSALDALEGGRP